MIAATSPIQRRPDAKLLVIDAQGAITHAARSALADLLAPHDLVIANDAATLPASLAGIHLPSGSPVEVRLAGRRTLDASDVEEFIAVVFGAGDFSTPTEKRPLPPPLAAGDTLQLGPLSARIVRLVDHPRLVRLRFAGTPASIWEGLARHGRPIQYAHIASPLALWDVWTPIAGAPVAFEPPSASFVLDWKTLRRLRDRRIEFTSITHAAGISSTGDPALDARLPFDEAYRIEEHAATAIRRARRRGGRIVAVGTSVVRALEHAALPQGIVRAGAGTATRKIGAATKLRVVDVIISGTHEPKTSHYELLRAFTSDDVLDRASMELDARGYRTHEFGDSVLIEHHAARRAMHVAHRRLIAA